MSAEKHEELERYWVEELGNPHNTIHFPKDRPDKFLCGVCGDDQERGGGAAWIIKQHSVTKTHQLNLKDKKKKTGNTTIVVSSDDEEEEEREKSRRGGRSRRSRSDEDDEKKKKQKKNKKTKEDEEEEQESDDDEESDSDRPSKKRERARDIDLAYRPTAAARVANSVATLPMTRRESSVVTPVPARAGPPLAQSLFAERFSNIIDKVMLSDIATDACRQEFYALLKTDSVQNQVRTHLKRTLKEQGPSVVIQVLREIIEEEEKERLQAFLRSDKAADMRADAYVRHLDGPQTQAFFAEGTQGFFNE